MISITDPWLVLCKGGTQDDTDGAMTDFAAAAQRARINSLDLETSKTPDDPVKVIGHVPRSRMKKMSDTGMYVSQTSVDTSEEEALGCARKDLIKLLNLQVSFVIHGEFFLYSLGRYSVGYATNDKIEYGSNQF